MPPAVFSSEALTFTKTRSPRGLTVETLRDTAAIVINSPERISLDGIGSSAEISPALELIHVSANLQKLQARIYDLALPAHEC